MIDFRILLGAVALFVGDYAGVSLLSKGGPFGIASRPAVAATPASPVEATAGQAPPATAMPDSAASVPPAAGGPPVLSEHELVQGRDRIRVSAIRAATAYALAPCDLTNKAAFVVAVSTYLRMLGSESDGAAALADERVRQVLQSALKAGGIAAHDFPPDAWPIPAGLAQESGHRPPACGEARRAERRSR